MSAAGGRPYPERDSFSRSEVAAYYSNLLPARPLKGGDRRGPCPIHRGSRDSFSVDPKTGDWYCHSQCGRGGDIYKLQMELTSTDFKTAAAEVHRIIGRLEPAARNKGPNRGLQKRGEIVATYDYVDEDDGLLFQCLRYNPKGFSQRRPDGRGGWIGNLNGVRRVHYRLPKLKYANRIFVVEGEKDVHTS